MSRLDSTLARRGGLFAGAVLAFALLAGFHSVVTGAVERGAMTPVDHGIVVAVSAPARTR